MLDLLVLLLLELAIVVLGWNVLIIHLLLLGVVALLAVTAA